jgi:hypothetical protein
MALKSEEFSLVLACNALSYERRGKELVMMSHEMFLKFWFGNPCCE